MCVWDDCNCCYLVLSLLGGCFFPLGLCWLLWFLGQCVGSVLPASKYSRRLSRFVYCGFCLQYALRFWKLIFRNVDGAKCSHEEVHMREAKRVLYQDLCPLWMGAESEEWPQQVVWFRSGNETDWMDSEKRQESEDLSLIAWFTGLLAFLAGLALGISENACWRWGWYKGDMGE